MSCVCVCVCVCNSIVTSGQKTLREHPPEKTNKRKANPLFYLSAM